MTVLATVVITTKNRGSELLRAVQSIVDQHAPVDILIIDDGSTDGTCELVRSQFPKVRLERSEQSLGLVVQRNRAAGLVSTPIIISIDDDAVLPFPNIIQQTLADFDHPRIGAVAMPYIDVKFCPDIRQQAPSPSGIYILDSYRGTAHALRRELFLKLGGYRGFLFQQGEEGDYCIRLLNAGYVVRAGRAVPLHHEASPNRDFTRIHLYSVRNNLLFVWNNAPLLLLPFFLAAATLTNLKHALHHRYFRYALLGLLRAFGTMPRLFSRRRPVSYRAFRLFRALIRSGPLKLPDIEPMLSPLSNLESTA